MQTVRDADIASDILLASPAFDRDLRVIGEAPCKLTAARILITTIAVVQNHPRR